NNTTSASNGPRAVSTVTLVVPATTCAFVITRSGAITKPEPSSARWQLGATPRMRSTLCCSEAATGLASTLGSGGSTAVIGGLPNGPITSGRPEVLSNRENSLGTRRSQFGATPSTSASTREPLMAVAMAGWEEVASGSASSQAVTSTATACKPAPTTLSTPR